MVRHAKILPTDQNRCANAANTLKLTPKGHKRVQKLIQTIQHTLQYILNNTKLEKNNTKISALYFVLIWVSKVPPPFQSKIPANFVLKRGGALFKHISVLKCKSCCISRIKCFYCLQMCLVHYNSNVLNIMKTAKINPPPTKRPMRIEKQIHCQSIALGLDIRV